LNADYIPSLQRRFGDRFEIIEGSADDFEEQMKTRNWPKADLIVSGLPFTLPKTVQDKLYASLLAQTEQGAVFRWFTYFPFLMKPHFRAFSFRLVKGVWFNLPPLWVYTVN
jgi:phospholipid N-methyltransferase